MKVILALAVLVCGAFAAYDQEMGTKLATITIDGVSCPVWAISHNTIHFDCQMNPAGLMFYVDKTKLTLDNKDGKIFLALRQTYALPYERNYKLSVERNGQMIASAQIPSNKMVPMPQVVPQLSTIAYEVTSGRITLVNANTIFIPRFNYNGKGPDAFFWVGQGSKPDEHGMIVPNEKGSKEVLGKYTSQDIILTLPEGVTVHDIDYLSVWCRAYKHDFGHVMFPEAKMVPPASYKPQVMDYSELVFKPVPESLMAPEDDSASSASHEEAVKEMKTAYNVEENSASGLLTSAIALLASFLAVLLC